MPHDTPHPSAHSKRSEGVAGERGSWSPLLSCCPEFSNLNETTLERLFPLSSAELQGIFRGGYENPSVGAGRALERQLLPAAEDILKGYFQPCPPPWVCPSCPFVLSTCRPNRHLKLNVAKQSRTLDSLPKLLLSQASHLSQRLFGSSRPDPHLAPFLSSY